MLTKEQILNAKDIKTQTEHVEEWGGDVIVSTISACERDRFEQEVVGVGKGKIVENLRARLVSRCLVDEKGNRLFAVGDVVLLGKKSARVLDRLFEVCQKLNGFSEKDIEELEKNSEEIQIGDSISS